MIVDGNHSCTCLTFDVSYLQSDLDGQLDEQLRLISLVPGCRSASTTRTLVTSDSMEKMMLDLGFAVTLLSKWVDPHSFRKHVEGMDLYGDQGCVPQVP